MAIAVSSTGELLAIHLLMMYAVCNCHGWCCLIDLSATHEHLFASVFSLGFQWKSDTLLNKVRLSGSAVHKRQNEVCVHPKQEQVDGKYASAAQPTGQSVDAQPFQWVLEHPPGWAPMIGTARPTHMLRCPGATHRASITPYGWSLC